MTCPKCHREIPGDAALCCYCGRRFVVPRGKKKKRANGEGNVYKRGPTYTVRVSAGTYTDDEGRIHRHRLTKGGFKTATEALAYAQTLKNGPLSLPDISMEKVYTEWSEGYRSRVGATTMAGYKAAFQHYGTLSARPIASIRPADLQARIDDCGKGRRTKQLMKVVAGLIWKFAIDNDLVVKNAAANLYTGSDPTNTRAPFTDLELQKLRNAVGSEPYAEYVLALCYTGFRPGELLELSKSSVNMDAGYIIGGGKTDAGTDRIVTIPPAISGIIRRRMDAPGEWLFPRLETGDRMSDQIFRDYCFAPLMTRLGISGKVPYSCRHTYSNLLKRAPGDSGDKARLMGHTDYAFTQKVYQTADLSDLKAITDALV